MAKAFPKTAEAVRARLDAMLGELTPDERKKFWFSLDQHPDNNSIQLLVDLINKQQLSSRKLLIASIQSISDLTPIILDLLSKLLKHRRPKTNIDRDKQIMKLYKLGKTAGEIVLYLNSQYKLTDRQVTAVISRERRKQKPK